MNQNDLATFESLSEKIYASTSDYEREQASRALQPFLQPPKTEYSVLLTQTQFILDNSSARYALVLASTTLSKIVGEHWNNFNAQTRLGLRNYLLNYLVNRAGKLDEFVTQSLIKLVCMVLKLSWLESTDNSQEIIQQLAQLLQTSAINCLLALRILTHLVEIMNDNKVGTLTPVMHRKIAISFRDTSLLQIFQISLNTLHQLSGTGATEEKLKEHALILAFKCLSFDFIGTTPDESASDVGTVQAPSTWRPILSDSATLRLFHDVYSTSVPPVSTQAMGCLVQMVSVRRTLFINEEERQQYLSNLMRMIMDILKSKKGLDKVDNHHEFCRLLYRLKSNYQLSQMKNVDGYNEWLTLLAEFTGNTFKSWQAVPNSGHYLLLMWSRLVSSQTYLKTDMATLLDTLTPRVLEAYINFRLESVQVFQEGDLEEDPLRNIDIIQEELDALPYLGRCNYPTTSAYLVSLFDPRAQSFQQNSAQMSSGGSVLEGQLAWLIYIMGATVGARIGVAPSQTDEHDTIDGEMSYRVFQLMQLHDQRVLARGAAGGDARLESSFLYFLAQFRRMYVGEQSLPSSKLYHRLSERIGLHDHVMVMQMIITKIVRNLKFWSAEGEIVNKSLSLVNDLATGYSSSKLLAKMDIITEIIEHHTSQYFPFLDYEANIRNRTTFYSIVAKMLFMEPHSARFANFMQPFKQNFLILHNRCATHVDALRQEDCKRALIFLLRDLLGVISSINNRRHYIMFFEWMYPEHTPLLLKAAEVWYDTPEVTTPLLKFMGEFAFNKSGRISFPNSSPDGILLFREASKLLVAYGTRLLRYTPKDPDDPYDDKYKGIWLSMQLLARALMGNYVNFGVFVLYGDPALSNALQIVLQLALSIPIQEMAAYPKVLRAYYVLLNVLAQNHTCAFIELDTPVFVQIVNSIKEGLTSFSSVLNVFSQCCDTLDHVFAYAVENRSKDNATMRAFTNHTSQHPEMLPQLLELLFHILVFEDASQWSVCRPLLGLILLFPKHFAMLEEQFVATQTKIISAEGGDPNERQQKLAEAFNKLMADIKDNILPKNRDKFTQNATLFRADVKGLLA